MPNNVIFNNFDIALRRGMMAFLLCFGWIQILEIWGFVLHLFYGAL